MKEYAAFLTLRIAYPRADFRQWKLLPSAASERHLARHRMRLSFADGELRIWGEKDFAPRAGDTEGAAPLLEFYLFCADPYFVRAGEVPVFRPGDELLLLTVSGTNEAPDMEVTQYGPERRAEVAAGRGKYFGGSFGPPPVGILRFAPPGREAPVHWRTAIPARRVYWVYRVSPRPAAPLSIQGACGFARREAEDAALFVSRQPLPLAARGVRGIHLMVEDEQGRLVPLMENLASPDMEGIFWDKDLGGYSGAVHIDLSGFSSVV